jgi:hypothetical protein
MMNAEAAASSRTAVNPRAVKNGRVERESV